MSGPTRGMVAGQPIRTSAETREYDEGFERTFGEKKVVRGRFRWDPERKEMVPLDEGWTDTERKAQTPTEELIYGGLGTSTDGTPINSRRKHREYMKQNDLALASDYEKTWEKAAKERAEYFTTGGDHRERRELIERIWHEKHKP